VRRTLSTGAKVMGAKQHDPLIAILRYEFH
jgi:hypothetical protein